MRLPAAMRVLAVTFAISSALTAQNLGNRAIRTPNGQIVPQGPAQQQQLPSDCAADGTVVDALTGRPLSHATVTLNTNDGKGTSTDANGAWSISNITCAPMIPSAERPGYIRNSYGRAPSMPLNGAGLKTVLLTSGSPAHEIKIELMPEAVVTGKVLDEAGEPAAGAMVRGIQSVVQNGKRITRMSGSATVDTSGTYRIGGVIAGKYIFCVNYNHMRFPVGGGDPSSYPEICYPGPVSGGNSSMLQIDGGREVRADFNLSTATGVHVRGTLSGGPEPGPAAPGFVQLLRVDPNGSGNGFMPVMAGGVRPQSVRDGKFDFVGVPPGSYMLLSNMQSLRATALVDVNGVDVDGVVLQFMSGVQVTGTVRMETLDLNTSTTDQPQAPPSRPPVNISFNPMGFGSPPRQPQWDADRKSFVFEGVMPGRYRLMINSPLRNYYVKSATLHDQDVLNEDIAISGPAGPLEIVLSNDSGQLQGTVNDAEGKPTASRVIVTCGKRLPVIGRSRDDGSLTMQNIPAGNCKAWAFDDNPNVEYADDEWMRRNAGIGTDIAISNASPAQVTLVRKNVLE